MLALRISKPTVMGVLVQQLGATPQCLSFYWHHRRASNTQARGRRRGHILQADAKTEPLAQSTTRYTYGWAAVNLEHKGCEATEAPWDNKIDKVFWRGASTGGGE